MISIPLSPEQYQAALNGLMQYKGGDLTSFLVPVNGQPGQIVTPQVTLDFTYTPNVLDLTIVEKHGIAKFASESTIKSHLQDMLTRVEG
ncbi:MAG: hypothetical protein ACRDHZ_00505 [Ktedonobacteraceae bacterium]